MNFEYELRQAMYARGFPYSGDIKRATGIYHAFSSENGNCKRKCCRYRLFENDLGAHIHCWRRGAESSNYWFIKSHKHFTADDKKQFARERELKERERIQSQKDAAFEAKNYWINAQEVNPSHPYIVRKKIRPLYAKQYGNKILLPIMNSNREIISTQEIQPDGFKKFAIGTSVSGGMLILGEHVTPIIRICEGWATGCSIYEAVGETVIVAFSGSNLKKVARTIQCLCPTVKLHICGDNEINGRRFAEDAAMATCSKSIYPDFSNLTNIGKDFNDLMTIVGIEEVQKQLLNTK